MHLVLTNQHCDNRGDESATIGLIESLRAEFGEETTITLYRQTREFQFLGEEHRVEERYMNHSPFFLGRLALWCAGKAVGLDLRAVLGKGIKQFLSTHEKADLVLSSCGGPYIGDLYWNHEILHLLYALAPELLGKKLVFAAPSMGPFYKRWMNPLRRAVLRRAAIVLRDPISYEYVQQFLKKSEGIYQAADACFAQPLPRATEKKKVIGFTPLDYGYPHAADKNAEKLRYKKNVAEFFDRLMEEDDALQVEFFPQLYAKHTDLPLIEEIRRMMRHGDRTIVFSDQLSGVEQQREIARLQMMVATRYHSAVFACKMGIPCICIAYEHKAVGMMQLFDLGDYVLQIEDVTVDRLMEKYRALVENRRQVQEKLDTAIGPVTRRAQLTAQVAHRWLKGELPPKGRAEQFFDDIAVNAFLCSSCGLCASVCPTGAISYLKNQFDQFTPRLNAGKCVDCGRCIRTCQVRALNEESPSVLGPWKEIWIASAAEDQLEKQGASGGVLTALAEYGLRTRAFDRLLSVSGEKDPVNASGCYFTAQTIRGTGGSKYISAPMGAAFDPTAAAQAVTALPCQAKTIRKIAPETFIFGLFCSKLSTSGLADYVMHKEKCEQEIKQIVFREGVWPGRATFRTEDKTFSYSIMRNWYSAVYNSFYFAVSGCLLCPDYTAQAADLSFGDPWGIRKLYQPQRGQTVVVVRTERGKALFDAALRDKVITAQPLSVDALVGGHFKEFYTKKTEIAYRAQMAQQLCGKLVLDPKGFYSPKKRDPYWKYAAKNNWVTRSKRNYRRVFSIPRQWVFLTRFLNLALHRRFLKRIGAKSFYTELARQEKIDAGGDEKEAN